MAIEKKDVSNKVWAFLEAAIAEWPQQVSYTFAELTEAIRGADGFRQAPAEKEKPWHAEPPAGAQDIILLQGRIYFCNLVDVFYQVVVSEGHIFYAPTMISRRESPSSGLGSLLGELCQAVTTMLPRHRIVMPEPGELLPVPAWVTGSPIQPATSVIMFRSEAEQLWAEFIAQKPFAK